MNGRVVMALQRVLVLALLVAWALGITPALAQTPAPAGAAAAPSAAPTGAPDDSPRGRPERVPDRAGGSPPDLRLEKRGDEPEAAGPARREDHPPPAERRRGGRPHAHGVARAPRPEDRRVHPVARGVGHRPRAPELQGLGDGRGPEAGALRAPQPDDGPRRDRARRRARPVRLAHEDRGPPAGRQDQNRLPFNYNKAVSADGEQENFYLRTGDIIVVP